MFRRLSIRIAFSEVRIVVRRLIRDAWIRYRSEADRRVAHVLSARAPGYAHLRYAANSYELPRRR